MNWCLLKDCDDGEAGETKYTPEEEVTVAREEFKLMLGKGVAFVKGRFKRLRQE